MIFVLIAVLSLAVWWLAWRRQVARSKPPETGKGDAEMAGPDGQPEESPGPGRLARLLGIFVPRLSMLGVGRRTSAGAHDRGRDGDEEGDEADEEETPFDTVVALCIAGLAMLGLYVGNLAADYAGAGYGAEYNAIVATVNREQAEVTAHTWLFQDLRAYTQHRRLGELRDATESAASAADASGNAALAAGLRDQARIYAVAANAAASFYSAEYVGPDGKFDEETFLAHQRRFESRNKDVDPDDDFAEALESFDHSYALTLSLTGLGAVEALFIVAQMTKNRSRFGWFASGVVLLTAVLAYTWAVETGVL